MKVTTSIITPGYETTNVDEIVSHMEENIPYIDMPSPSSSEYATLLHMFELSARRLMGLSPMIDYVDVSFQSSKISPENGADPHVTIRIEVAPEEV